MCRRTWILTSVIGTFVLAALLAVFVLTMENATALIAPVEVAILLVGGWVGGEAGRARARPMAESFRSHDGSS